MIRRFDSRTSVARHIIDGTIEVDSVDELKRMLAIFPANPVLQTAYADLLGAEKQDDSAAAAYAHAVELYLSEGLLLSAILCKICQWRLQNPSHKEARQFFADLNQMEFEACPLIDFLKQLSYPEMIGVTNRMARLRLSPGQVIKKIGDPEDALYLIASGTIRETTYMPLRPDETTQPKTSVYLGENDVFGNVFPFEEELRSQSFAETITSVEMGKISKKRLIEICRKYPDLAQAIMVLFEAQADLLKKRASRGVRRADRHELPVKIDLDVFTNGHRQPAYKVHGFSRDISVGGVCCLLDRQSMENVKDVESIKGADVKVWLPSKTLTLTVSGKVVWCRTVEQGEDKTIALGIQFKEMTPKMSGMLVVFADLLSEGD